MHSPVVAASPGPRVYDWNNTSELAARLPPYPKPVQAQGRTKNG